MIEDVKFVVEELLVDQYGGFSIEYVDNWMSKGFQVRATYGGSNC